MSSSSSRCMCCLYSGLAVLMRGHWQQYVFVSPNFIAWRFDSQKFPQRVSARRLKLSPPKA
jgi:hypothetical protein